MARLLTNGAETQVPLTATASQDGQGEGFILTGTPTIATATPRSGAAYFSCAPSAANYIQGPLTTVLGRTYYLRAALRFDTAPVAALNVIQFQAGATLLGGIRLLSGTTTLRLFDTVGTVGASSASLSTGTWYVIEVAINVPAAGNGTLDYRIDGVAAAQGVQTANVGTTAITAARTGHNTAGDTSTTILVDDIAINDDQGASQNSWPGLGKVILLKPVADSAVGGSWQNPDNSTTTLFDDVDNTPPVGVASPGSGKSQIKDAASETASYDAAVTDYTTAGIQAGDSIVLTRMLARLSGSSLTGTNDGTGQVVSNPADAGATTWTACFDVVAVTEPSGWKTWITPYVYAPAVTKGTRPVIRVTKNTAATRVHMASLMVLEVEYLYLLGLNTSAGASTATLALTAPTGISLGTSAAVSTATLAVTATTQVPLVASAGASTATLALTAPSTIALASAGTSTATLDLTAPSTGEPVPLDPSAGVSTATLSLSAATQIALASAGAASATLALSAKTAIPLGTSAATASATLALSAKTGVALGTSSATASASLTISTPIQVPLVASSALASATLSLRAATRVPLNASAGSSTASLAIVFTPEVHLQPSVGTSSATLALKTLPNLILTSAGTSSATFTFTVPAGLPLHAAIGAATAILQLHAPTYVVLAASHGQSGGRLWLDRSWRHHFGSEWPEDQGSEWPEDEGNGWPAEVGTGWTPSSGNEWE